MSVSQAVVVSLLQYIPMSFIRWVLNDSPTHALDHVRNTNTVSTRIILELINDRRTMGSGGKKDIMSSILKAGLNDDPSSRLTDHEIVSELR
jgi:cytochrome P450